MKSVLLLVFSALAALNTSGQVVKPNALAAKKIADAMPAVLPQVPTDGRTRSDAVDVGLKGPVMSVTYRRTDHTSGRKNVLEQEEFYGENGNRIRAVDWDGNFPTGVTVFGYLDGMRVSRWGNIEYTAKEKPELSCIPLVQTVPDAVVTAAPKGDPRYNLRYVYKYDRGRLIEETHLGNGGELLTRTSYTYETASRRVVLHYAGGIDPIAKTLEIINPDNGNVIEERLYDESGEVNTILLSTYKYDRYGNWTVQTVTEKRVYEDWKPKLTTRADRTILYY